MDGPSFPSQAYTLPSVSPTDARTPPARGDAASPQTRDPGTAQSQAAPPPSNGPGFVVAFSPDLSGGYVLDYRDPKTDVVLVQVPMRSAFAQMEGAATPEHVGKLVDTTA